MRVSLQIPFCGVERFLMRTLYVMEILIEQNSLLFLSYNENLIKYFLNSCL